MTCKTVFLGPIPTSFGRTETHLGLEAHIKHAVGFVEHKVGDTLHADDLTAVSGQELDHTTRGADDNLDATLELGNVVFERRAAVQTASLHTKPSARHDSKDEKLNKLTLRPSALRNGLHSL